MPHPNQITACASATRQGIYTPEIHMYHAEAHPRYGLLATSYFFKGRTRSRIGALDIARRIRMQAEKMTPTEAREFLLTNCIRSH